jgi:hypothetical protein
VVIDLWMGDQDLRTGDVREGKEEDERLEKRIKSASVALPRLKKVNSRVLLLPLGFETSD